MRKRILCISFILFSTVFLCAASSYGIYEYEESMLGDGVVITGCNSDFQTVISIPDAIDSKPVIGIESEFLVSDAVTEVKIPASVYYISYGAFSEASSLEAITVHPDNGCYASIHGILYDKRTRSIACYPQAITTSSFEIPVGIEYIDPRAFEGTSNLKYVTAPDSLKEIGYWAFNNSGIISINIPEGVEEIGIEAFFNCNSLEELSLPSTLSYLGSSAIVSRSLQAITVADSNPYYCSIEGVLFTEDCSSLIAYPASKDPWGYYSIPESVKTIMLNAFCYAKINNILLPENLKEIGNSAFWGSGIDYIVLPDSITSIGVDIFDNCSYLENIFVSEGSYAYRNIAVSEWARYLVYEPSWLGIPSVSGEAEIL